MQFRLLCVNNVSSRHVVFRDVVIVKGDPRCATVTFPRNWPEFYHVNLQRQWRYDNVVITTFTFGYVNLQRVLLSKEDLSNGVDFTVMHCLCASFDKTRCVLNEANLATFSNNYSERLTALPSAFALQSNGSKLHSPGVDK